jgi:serine protease Do
LDNVTPDLAKAWNLPSTNGVAITKVDPDTPAAKGGLKAGDVVTEVNGEGVVDTAALRLRIASMAPGATAKMHVIRNGAPMDVNVTLGERPADLDARGPRGQRGGPGNQEGTQSGLEGVSVDELTPEVAQQLGIPNDVHGVVITDVDQASAAADAGLEQGDVIEQVNRQPVRTVADFNRLVKQANGSTVLLINRGGGRHFVAIQSK